MFPGGVPSLGLGQKAAALRAIAHPKPTSSATVKSKGKPLKKYGVMDVINLVRKCRYSMDKLSRVQRQLQSSASWLHSFPVAQFHGGLDPCHVCSSPLVLNI